MVRLLSGRNMSNIVLFWLIYWNQNKIKTRVRQLKLMLRSYLQKNYFLNIFTYIHIRRNNNAVFILNTRMLVNG